MSLRVDANQRAGRHAASPSLEDVQQRVLRFVRDEAGFAQVVTINRDGFPVGRSMVAPLEEDWSVTLVQRSVHKRLGQLRRNPKLEIIWRGEPAPDNVNDRPHVYDYGHNAPRVVFLRGIAEFLDAEETIRRFRTQTERNLARGQRRAPARSDDNIRQELVGIHVRPIQVRVEGFGVGAESFTWTIAAQA